MYARKLSILCLVAITTPVLVHPKRSQKKQVFIQSHRLPQEVIDIADTIFNKDTYKAVRKSKRKKLLAAGFIPHKVSDNVVLEHPDLPGWVIKFGHRFRILFSTIARIPMAESISAFVEENNLTSIHVPKKYLYHIPHRKHKLVDKNYLVFCEKIVVRPKKEPRVFNQHVIDDMLKVINHFAIMDASPGNMGRIDNDNISMLDTEPTNRMGGGLWYAFDNSFVRWLKRQIGKRVFLNSLDEK